MKNHRFFFLFISCIKRQIILSKMNRNNVNLTSYNTADRSLVFIGCLLSIVQRRAGGRETKKVLLFLRFESQNHYLFAEKKKKKGKSPTRKMLHSGSFKPSRVHLSCGWHWKHRFESAFEVNRPIRVRKQKEDRNTSLS